MSTENGTVKKKLAFAYRLLKPNDNEEVEYSFEQLRAIQYNAIYDKRSLKENEMEKEIAGLKQKLAEMESKMNDRKEIFNSYAKEAETNTTVSLKDLTNNKKKSFNNDDTNVYHKASDNTRANYYDNNFTNVSLMSTFTKPYDRRSNETEDYSTTNWISHMTKPASSSVFPTPKVTFLIIFSFFDELRSC